MKIMIGKNDSAEIIRLNFRHAQLQQTRRSSVLFLQHDSLRSIRVKRSPVKQTSVWTEMNVNLCFFCSTDRDVRRRKRGGGEATGPRTVVHELTPARPHCPASAPRASLTPRPSLLSWPFDGTHVPSQYQNDASYLKVKVPLS